MMPPFRHRHRFHAISDAIFHASLYRRSEEHDVADAAAILRGCRRHSFRPFRRHAIDAAAAAIIQPILFAARFSLFIIFSYRCRANTAAMPAIDAATPFSATPPCHRWRFSTAGFRRFRQPRCRLLQRHFSCRFLPHDADTAASFRRLHAAAADIFPVFTPLLRLFFAAVSIDLLFSPILFLFDELPPPFIAMMPLFTRAARARRRQRRGSARCAA